MPSLCSIPKHSLFSYFSCIPSYSKRNLCLSQKSVDLDPFIFPYLELSFFIQNLPFFSSYFIHPFCPYMRLTSCRQKQTQFMFRFMFSCLLTLFFSFNLLHLYCGILTEEFHHLLSGLFFRLPLFLCR